MDKWTHKHRNISHYPLITIPICAASVYSIAGLPYCIILGIAMLGHYLRDIPEPGWGIRLFFPFSKRFIAYRSRDGREQPKWYAWTWDEQIILVHTFGKNEWVRDTFLWITSVLMLFGGIIVAAAWMYAH